MRQGASIILFVLVIGLLCFTIIHDLTVGDAAAGSNRTELPKGPRGLPVPTEQFLKYRDDMRVQVSEDLAPLARDLLDELSQQQDDAELERRLRLSKFFLKWGSVDVDGALRFLEQEELVDGNRLSQPIVALAPLALFGYSDRNTADAWRRLDAFANDWVDSRENALWTNSHLPPPIHRVAEDLFAKWWDLSESEAEAWLFSQGKNSALKESALKAILQKKLSPEKVHDLMERYVTHHGALVGMRPIVTLCSQDVELATHYLSSDYLEMINRDYADMMMRVYWAQEDPVNAYAYVMNGESADERNIRFWSWYTGAMAKEPVLVLRAIRTEEFSHWRDELGPQKFIETCLAHIRGYHWPLNDKEYEMQLESRALTELRVELENGDYPVEMKKSYLEAIRRSEEEAGDD